MSDFMAIIKREVPIASFMGIFSIMTRAGIMRKPPPAPTSPVTAPVMIPSIIRIVVPYLKVAHFFTFFCFRIIE
jgi:hypothetical protein